MFRIPELYRTRIGYSRERASRGVKPIRRENRLPHHQHAQFYLWIRFQDLLGCGGPPQAIRSSGRKKKNEARFLRRGIKSILEIAQVRRGERHHRRLRRRSMRRPVLKPRQNRDGHCREREDRFPARFRSHRTGPAISPAIHCGKIKFVRTIAAATQRIAPDHRARSRSHRGAR